MQGRRGALALVAVAAVVAVTWVVMDPLAPSVLAVVSPHRDDEMEAWGAVE